MVLLWSVVMRLIWSVPLTVAPLLRPRSWSRDVAGRADPVPVAGDGDVTAAGHVLVIRSARRRHAGWYRCRADTATGHVTTKLRLQVQVGRRALSVCLSLFMYVCLSVCPGFTSSHLTSPARALRKQFEVL